MQTAFFFQGEASPKPQEEGTPEPPPVEPARAEAEAEVEASAPAPREAAARLSVELEAALLRELHTAYADLNASFFRRKLETPAFALSDAEGRLGSWVPDTRTLELSRRLLLERPWGVVLEVLKHEMAHQWVHEVLKQTSETAHGPAFRATCDKLGIDASASGVPEAALDDREARVLERVARLLALAESSNENEAQAAATAAQRLMLKYNLEQAASRRPRAYAFRHLGRPSGRILEPERVLAAILGRHFFVDVIWVPIYMPHEGRRATVLEVCGTPENLGMAEYVHGFLDHTAAQLWQQHQKQTGARRRDRVTFLAGVMLGFLEKLDHQRVAQKAEGLVWVKDGDLRAYLHTRNPHIHAVRRQGARRNEAHKSGREAGGRIVIHKPVDGGTSNRGKLLPPKR